MERYIAGSLDRNFAVVIHRESCQNHHENHGIVAFIVSDCWTI